jgi:hypothetical protein
MSKDCQPVETAVDGKPVVTVLLQIVLLRVARRRIRSHLQIRGWSAELLRQRDLTRIREL